jgi:Zn/Cd-binding protein ZinT
MKNRKFKMFNLCPFDLMRFTRDQFYENASCEYNKQQRERYNADHKNIEILEANVEFIKNGLQVTITCFKEKE